jgi:protein ImuA
MLGQLRQSLRALENPAGIEGSLDALAVLPLGVPAIDAALGGGLARGALHEIAAAGEAHVGAAAGFALAVTLLATNSSSRSVGLSRQGRGERKSIVWITEDMALAESGAPYGPGLDTIGFTPERLVTIATAHVRDLLWAMEEALRCRAVAAVIGELRHGEIDSVAVRRLSLAAGQSGALALMLRASPPHDASTAATRWIVGAARSSFAGGSHTPFIPVKAGIQDAPSPWHSSAGSPLSWGRTEDVSTFAVTLTRNRRGALGAWTLQWSQDDGRFALATHAQPVAAPAADRPHRQIA